MPKIWNFGVPKKEISGLHTIGRCFLQKTAPILVKYSPHSPVYDLQPHIGGRNPVLYLIVTHYSSMSWFKFRNLSVIVNCVTKSLNRSHPLRLVQCQWVTGSPFMPLLDTGQHVGYRENVKKREGEPFLCCINTMTIESEKKHVFWWKITKIKMGKDVQFHWFI